MELEVGSILDGKVTGITKFGAFVALPGGRSGLVHISEIAYTYVREVTDYLQVGQEVRVKLTGIDDNGRINLSIKKAQDPPAKPVRTERAPAATPRENPVAGQTSFEDKLKRFMQDSDSRLSGARGYGEKQNRRRGGRSGGSGDNGYYDD